MENNENSLMSTWEVSSFRITGFISPGETLQNPETWWEKVFKSSPDTDQYTRVNNQRLLEGKYKNSLTSLSINPIRIDWRIGVPIENIVNSGEFITLGSFSKFIDDYIIFLADQWFGLDIYPKMQRLAFAVDLIQPVKSKKAGYETLSSLLKTVEIDPEGSYDFLYQINRRRLSRIISNLEINRLSKWNVNNFTGIVFGLNPNYVGRMVQPEGVYFCGLALDINTSANYDGEFNSTDSRKLFGELLDFAKEIATKGDVK